MRKRNVNQTNWKFSSLVILTVMTPKFRRPADVFSRELINWLIISLFQESDYISYTRARPADNNEVPRSVETRQHVSGIDTALTARLHLSGVMSDRAADANTSLGEHFCAQVYIIVADNWPVMCCASDVVVDFLVRGGWHPRCRGYFRRRRRIRKPSPAPSGRKPTHGSCRVGILTHPLSKTDREEDEQRG
jgi:hypothetical protein